MRKFQGIVAYALRHPERDCEGIAHQQTLPATMGGERLQIGLILGVDWLSLTYLRYFPAERHLALKRLSEQHRLNLRPRRH